MIKPKPSLSAISSVFSILTRLLIRLVQKISGKIGNLSKDRDRHRAILEAICTEMYFSSSFLFSPTPIIPSTCRFTPERERTTAEDPAGRLAGRAYPRCDSRGGIPRRALTPHRQGGADHDVPQPGELRLQRSGRCGQPGCGSRSRGRSGRSR